MNIDQTKEGLQAVANRLSPILESNGRQIIEEAIADLEAAKQNFDRYKNRYDVKDRPEDWGYAISPDNPLRFVIAKDKGYELRPDIFCDIRWQTEDQPPVARDLVLRVWTPDRRLIYREEWDSSYIEEEVTDPRPSGMKERVLLRCHFDLANKEQRGPEHHFQIGGKPHENEYGWYPKEVDLPRLCHYPLDLVLLCELVAANFFPNRYSEVKADPSWKRSVKRAEAHFTGEYFQKCAEIVSNSKADTLLTHLWNITFD